MSTADLVGKSAIVTGGGSGIGRGVAAAFVAAGANVLICGRDRERLESACQNGGRNVRYIVADITLECDVDRLFAEAERIFSGRLDILVNNAGRSTIARTEDLSVQDFEGAIALNVTSAFRCALRAFRIMKAQGGGRIINIGSVSSRVPRGNSVPYTTSKFALDGMTRALALDGRSCGIAVSVLHPGNTESGIWSDQEKIRAAEGLMPADQVARAALLMASLPADINMLEATMLPLKMPFLGRG